MSQVRWLIVITLVIIPSHGRADPPGVPMPKSDRDYDALRNSLEPPPPLPRRTPPVDPLQRLQHEVDDFKKARSETPASPVPAPMLPPEASPSGGLEERAKLRSRLDELFEQLLKKNAAAPAATPTHAEPAHDVPHSAVAPADRLRQAQNLFRIGEVRAAQRALLLIDPNTLAGKQPSLWNYMKASCHRRLGELAPAKQIYAELAESKEDEFLAECAAWQLQALRTREELTLPLDTTRTPSSPR